MTPGHDRNQGRGHRERERSALDPYLRSDALPRTRSPIWPSAGGALHGRREQKRHDAKQTGLAPKDGGRTAHSFRHSVLADPSSPDDAGPRPGILDLHAPCPMARRLERARSEGMSQSLRSVERRSQTTQESLEGHRGGGNSLLRTGQSHEI